jgi:outer membrane lipoprotein-sorting protein
MLLGLRGWVAVLGLAVVLAGAARVGLGEPEAPAAGGAGAGEAAAILAAAEALRNPAMSYAAGIQLRSARGAEGEFVSSYAMKSADRDRTLIIGTSPEHYRGRVLLRSARQYYLHLKSVKQPLRVAPQQGFRGDVANADIARVDYVADYEPALAGEEMIDGKACHVLELVARANEVAYRRVRYWAEKESGRPVKTEHYAVSGRLLKIVHYEDYRRSLGAMRPHRMRLVDGIDPTQITVIEYTDLREESFPDRIFSPSYLDRLEE